MIKAIVFDFDGTLADSFTHAMRAARSLARQVGRPVPKNIELLREKSIFEVLQELHLSRWYIFWHQKEFIRIYKQGFGGVSAFPHLRSMLARLHERFAVAVVSSNDQTLVESFLSQEKIDSIDFVYTNRSVFGKGRLLKKMLRSNHLTPQEILYIGDEIRDVRACRKAGIRIISVSWGFNTKASLEGCNPGMVVDTPRALHAKIMELAGKKTGKAKALHPHRSPS